jgi:hypothetical protein
LSSCSIRASAAKIGEQRKSERKALAQSAAIENSVVAHTLNCISLDISDGGVKLQINEPALVPDEFVLLLSRFGSVRRRCSVVWGSDDQLGAQFLDGQH